MTATTASTLVERFDAGKDVLDYFDTENPLIEEPDPSEPKQVSITIPLWLVNWLDQEAARRGIARKAVINTALVEWSDEQREKALRLFKTA